MSNHIKRKLYCRHCNSEFDVCPKIGKDTYTNHFCSVQCYVDYKGENVSKFEEIKRMAFKFYNTHLLDTDKEPGMTMEGAFEIAEDFYNYAKEQEEGRKIKNKTCLFENLAKELCVKYRINRDCESIRKTIMDHFNEVAEVYSMKELLDIIASEIKQYYSKQEKENA